MRSAGNGMPTSCIPNAPTEEVCDGKDNDCNALADDGTAPSSCEPGAICHDGKCELGCLIGEILRAPDTFNPSNPCESCQPTLDTSAWSPVDLLDFYRQVSPEQVLYASDYPYGQQPSSLLIAVRTARFAGFDDRQLRDMLYGNASPRLKRFFEVYARGVNAYLFRYRDKLPMDLAESGYRPPYWTAEDSVLVFCLLNFGLSVNLQEEIAAQVAESNNRTLFVLTSVTVLALPINLIAGLFGMNVGGLPLAESGHGFATVVSLVIGLTALLAWWMFRDRDR